MNEQNNKKKEKKMNLAFKYNSYVRDECSFRTDALNMMYMLLLFKSISIYCYELFLSLGFTGGKEQTGLY